MDAKNTVKTSTLKCGRRTYFFDVNLSKNNSKYLKISETQMPKEEGGEVKRNSFLLFGEDAGHFHQMLGEVMTHLA